MCFLYPNMDFSGLIFTSLASAQGGGREGGPSSSRGQESTGCELETDLDEGPRLACWVTGASPPQSEIQFPHLENEGLWAGSLALPPLTLFILSTGSMARLTSPPIRWPGRGLVPYFIVVETDSGVVCSIWPIRQGGRGSRPPDSCWLGSLHPGPGCGVCLWASHCSSLGL